MATLRLLEDWTAIKQCIVDWARANVASNVAVYWHNQDAPVPDLPRVQLGIMGVPEKTGEDIVCDVSECVIDVAEVANLTGYTVSFGGISYVYTSGASATLNSIRDGLISMINGLVGVGWTASVFGTGQVLLTPSGISQLLVGIGENLLLRGVFVFDGQRILTVTVDVYTRQSVQDVLPIVEGLKTSLGLDPCRVALKDCGISVSEVASPRNLDENIGGVWLDRAGFDLRLALASRVRKPGEYIETAHTCGLIYGGVFSPREIDSQ